MVPLHFIGIPYVSKGRSQAGCDCWGIVFLYYLEVLGIRLPEYADGYSDSAEEEEVAKLVASGRRNWVEVSPPQAGDVVLLRIFKDPVHVGVYLDGHRVLHVRKGTNACIQRLDDSFWRSRIEGFYRYVG
ncbi:MAG: C40 family peptidase [bacterium]